MRRDCFKCGYLRKLREPDDSITYYCDDRDFYVDPYDMDCDVEG